MKINTKDLDLFEEARRVIKSKDSVLRAILTEDNNFFSLGLRKEMLHDYGTLRIWWFELAKTGQFKFGDYVENAEFNRLKDSAKRSLIFRHHYFYATPYANSSRYKKVFEARELKDDE